jgi:hypothetical protein
MKKIATNPQIIYTIVRSLATLLVAFGIFELTDAELEQIVAAAGAVYIAVDILIKAVQAK